MGDDTIPRITKPCVVRTPVMSSVISPEITSLGEPDALGNVSRDGVSIRARTEGCTSGSAVASQQPKGYCGRDETHSVDVPGGATLSTCILPT